MTELFLFLPAERERERDGKREKKIKEECAVGGADEGM